MFSKNKSQCFLNICSIILCLITSISLLGSNQAINAQIIINEVKSSSSAKQKRKKGTEMLKIIKKHLKQTYYDSNFKGIDINKRFDEAKENIKKMNHNWQIFREIAQVLLEFNDSHTKFYPPQRSTRVDYGFTMQMIGKNCFITKVKKGSDAEKKGIKPGFIITSIGRYSPTRESLWKINYLIKHLDPVKTIPLTIVGLDGKKNKVNVNAKFTTLKERKSLAKKKKKKNQKDKKDYKCKQINPDIVTCKLKTFSTEKSQIRAMIREVNKHKKFILDLRGNRGGLVKIEQYLTGFFFNEKIKIGDFVTRKGKEERFSMSVGDKVFKGDLIVLIDSNSASAAEVFARTIQIEERGRIIGDISAGAVMTSYFLNLSIVRGSPGNQMITPFSLNLTMGDLIMSDGKRLEHVGVTPEILIGPNSKALAEKKDPVLAYAAQLFGAEVSDDETGKFGFLY